MALDENNDLTDIYKYLKYYNISNGLLSMATGWHLYIENVFYCVTLLLGDFHPGFLVYSVQLNHLLSHWELFYHWHTL